jgi:hypothetical protein
MKFRSFEITGVALVLPPIVSQIQYHSLTLQRFYLSHKSEKEIDPDMPIFYLGDPFFYASQVCRAITKMLFVSSP